MGTWRSQGSSLWTRAEDGAFVARTPGGAWFGRDGLDRVTAYVATADDAMDAIAAGRVYRREPRQERHYASERGDGRLPMSLVLDEPELAELRRVKSILGGTTEKAIRRAIRALARLSSYDIEELDTEEPQP